MPKILGFDHEERHVAVVCFSVLIYVFELYWAALCLYIIMFLNFIGMLSMLIYSLNGCVMRINDLALNV